MRQIKAHSQRGVFLLEALIGIIIFSIGVLTMVALQAKSIEIQADTQYRVEAANLAERMLGDIAIRSRDNTGAVNTGTLANFSHRATTTANCNFTGANSGDATVTAWVTDITTGAGTQLPGSSSAMQQILVDTATFNKVTISICWQAAADAVPRRHTLVSYVN
jgi:type IV pilus assembly protein PilV